MNGSVSHSAILALIVGMAALNFAIRFVPIAVLSRFELPDPVLRWLSFVPISVMGALVTSEVLLPAGEWHPPATNPGFYAAGITALAFRFTRSFLGATVVGVASFVALRALL